MWNVYIGTVLAAAQQTHITENPKLLRGLYCIFIAYLSNVICNLNITITYTFAAEATNAEKLRQNVFALRYIVIHFPRVCNSKRHKG